MATWVFDVVPFADAAHGDSVLWTATAHREHVRLADDGACRGDLRAVAVLVACDRRDGSIFGGPR